MTWQGKVIQAIWTHILTNWRQQNDDQHSVNAATQEAALLSQAHKETQALHDV